MSTPDLDQAIARVQRSIVAGDAPPAAAVATLVQHGAAGLARIFDAQRNMPANRKGDFRAAGELWLAVLGKFCKSHPVLVASTFENPPVNCDPSGLIRAIGANPSPLIADRLIVWLGSDNWTSEHAANGLLALRWEPAIPPLFRLLAERPDNDACHTIIRAMFEWPELRTPALPFLRRYLEHLLKANEYWGTIRWAKELIAALEAGQAPVVPDELRQVRI